MTTTALDASNTALGTANAAGIWIADLGTAPPTDTITAWGAGWSTLGYLSEDGVTLAVETDSEDITPWQSKSPLRTVITGKKITLEFTMFEATAQNLALYFDQAIPTETAGAFSLQVRSDSSQKQYAIGIDTKDGDTVIRYIFPRASISENGEVEIVAGNLQGFPVTLAALDDNGVLATILKGPAA